MNISLLIYLFIGIIFLFLILYLIKISRNSGGGPEPNPPCVGPGCDPNKNENCSVFNVNSIKHCDKDEDCYKCADNGGNMSCQSSTDYAVDLSQSNCLAPNYIYDVNTSTCYLAPNQNICLPFDLNSNFECNKYTGVKVLTKPASNLPYNWKCLCRDNTKFTNKGELGSDCKDIKLCGMQETTNKNSTNGNHLVRLGTENYDEPTDWTTDSNWNPFSPNFGGEGACKCNTDSYADQINLRCIRGTCYPGTPTNDGTDCNCSHPYIKCSDINYATDSIYGKYSLGLCDIPSCIPDPCITGPDDKLNHYDPGSKKCICSGENTISVPSEQVPGGTKCQNVCANNGPCGIESGKRGTCYAEKGDDHDKTTYWHFLTDDEGRCLIQHIESEPKRYLNIFDDGHLGNDIAGSEFYIVPYCSGTTANADGSCISPNGAKGVKNLTTNSKYMFRDVFTGKYIGLNDDTGILELTTDYKKYIQWTFDQSGSSINVGSIMYPTNNYIVPNGDALVTTTKWQNSARCKDCIKPAQQDISTGLCNEKPCLKYQFQCDNDDDCCSKDCKKCSPWNIFCEAGCR